MSTSTTEYRYSSQELPDWYLRLQSYGSAQPTYTTNSVTPTATTATGSTVPRYPFVEQAPLSDVNTGNRQPNPTQPPQETPCVISKQRFFIGFLGVIMLALILTTMIMSKYHTPMFKVDTFAVSSFNVSDSKITAKWDIGILVENPNKFASISYHNISVTVSYKNESLCEVVLTPFLRQRPKNQMSLHGNVDALSADIKKLVSSDIDEDMAHGEVDFNVQLHGRTRSSVWGEPSLKTNVICGNVKVRFETNATEGTMLGGPTHCVVHQR